MEVRAKLLLFAFALLLAMPLLLAGFADHKRRASWEKRELTSAQAVLDAIGSEGFFSELQRLVNDHLFGAVPVNRAYRQFQYAWLGDAPVPNVALGEGGLVFLTSHSADLPLHSLEQFCAAQSDEVMKLHGQFASLAEELALRGVSLTVAAVPSKLALYTERLPPSIPAALRRDCLAAVPEQLVATRLAALADSYRMFYPFAALRELRDTPHYYPPGNFHANSRVNHEFARRYLESSAIAISAAYSVTPRLKTINADLQLMGFERETLSWRYAYADFGVKRLRRAPKWLRPVYARARGFSRFNTAAPLSERRALMLSDSFGAYIAPHLAPGYRHITHVNIRELGAAERSQFLDTALRESRADELIILVHDAGLPNAALRRFLEG